MQTRGSIGGACCCAADSTLQLAHRLHRSGAQIDGDAAEGKCGQGREIGGALHLAREALQLFEVILGDPS